MGDQTEVTWQRLDLKVVVGEWEWADFQEVHRRNV